MIGFVAPPGQRRTTARRVSPTERAKRARRKSKVPCAKRSEPRAERPAPRRRGAESGLAGIEQHDAYTFDFSGLLRYEGGNFVPKPGFDAFQRGALALEGCSQKSPVATACAKGA